MTAAEPASLERRGRTRRGQHVEDGAPAHERAARPRTARRGPPRAGTPRRAGRRRRSAPRAAPGDRLAGQRRAASDNRRGPALGGAHQCVDVVAAELRARRRAAAPRPRRASCASSPSRSSRHERLRRAAAPAAPAARAARRARPRRRRAAGSRWPPACPRRRACAGVDVVEHEHDAPVRGVGVAPSTAAATARSSVAGRFVRGLSVTQANGRGSRADHSSSSSVLPKPAGATIPTSRCGSGPVSAATRRGRGTPARTAGRRPGRASNWVRTDLSEEAAAVMGGDLPLAPESGQGRRPAASMRSS